MASGANPGETIYTIEAITALPAHHGDPARGAAGSVAAERRTGARHLRQLPAEWVDAAAQPMRAAPLRAARTRGRRDGRRRAAAGTPGFADLAFKAIKSDDGGASLDTFFPKTLSRDLYAPRGWRIDASREDTRLPRQIVFTLDRPLNTPAGARLRIRLKHQGAVVGQSLGRFRLSVTSSEHAAARRGDPGEAAADPGHRRGGTHRAAAQGSRRRSTGPSRRR